MVNLLTRPPVGNLWLALAGGGGRGGGGGKKQSGRHPGPGVCRVGGCEGVCRMGGCEGVCVA